MVSKKKKKLCGWCQCRFGEKTKAKGKIENLVIEGTSYKLHLKCSVEMKLWAEQTGRSLGPKQSSLGEETAG